MRSQSRMNFVVAVAVLGAAMLSFVGEASAQQAAGSGSGTGTVIKMCECRGSCKLVTSCLLNYCYSETICDDCANGYLRFCYIWLRSVSRVPRNLFQ
jgi:hypothetical protein